MEVRTTGAAAADVTADALVVGVTSPPELVGAVAAADSRLDGLVGRLVADGEVRGRAGEVTMVHPDGRLPARRLVLAGLGRRGSADGHAVRLAVARAVTAAARARARSVAVAVDTLPGEPAAAARLAVEGAVLGAYRYRGRRTTPPPDGEPPPPPAELVLAGAAGEDERAARRALVVAEATNRARDLQYAPPNELGPQQLAERALAVAAAHPALTAEVEDEAGIAARGMGAFLAVAQGAPRGARLITMRHEPARTAGDVVLGLVGKGVTYDTGGLSIKTRKGLIGMKTDMAGAAAVIETVGVIAALDLPLRVVAVAGSADNVVDGTSTTPDTVVTAANGRTIEIVNTDAEGRLILADCMHHARALGATHLIDVATLTGAVSSALGDVYAAAMGRPASWVEAVRAAGERAGEDVWELPLHDRWMRLLRSDVADMTNSSDSGLAGCAYAGRFLQEFAGDGPWVHLDIAGVAWLDRVRGDLFPKGPTGWGVRLLVELAESLC
jgi:leucyl aminopeptidase